MNWFLNIIHSSALVFTLVLAPLLYLASMLYRRQFKNIELEWKKPQIVFFTILCFILNLALFILACFFFAGYYGSVNIDIIELSPAAMWQLSVDSLLYFMGITALYVSVQNFYVQYVCKEGILLQQFDWKTLSFKNHYIFWEDIKDYYIRSDYPLTYYNFIVQQPNDTYVRNTLKVPFYALSKFETILEINLKQQKEARAYSRAMMKKISKDSSLE